MKCPKCKRKAKASATKFIEYSHTQRRIRTCECGFKFVTHEIIEPDKQDLGKTSKEKKKYADLDSLDNTTDSETPF